LDLNVIVKITFKAVSAQNNPTYIAQTLVLKRVEGVPRSIRTRREQRMGMWK